MFDSLRLKLANIVAGKQIDRLFQHMGVIRSVNEKLQRENLHFEAALMEISAQVTPGANATVKRMSAIADKALLSCPKS